MSEPATPEELAEARREIAWQEVLGARAEADACLMSEARFEEIKQAWEDGA